MTVTLSEEDIKDERSAQWSKRRAGNDRYDRGNPPKTRDKAIHLVRRLAIVILSIFYKKYRNAKKPSLDTVKNVLIISHFPIGDLVLTSPLWKTLKRRNPGLRIGLAISKQNAVVLAAESGIDHTYDFFSPGLFRMYGEMRRARHDGWDVVLATAGFYKPVRFAFVSRFITKGITATAHSSRHWRYAKIYSLCFKRPAPGEYVPMVEQYQNLVESTFDIKFTEAERKPEFIVTPEALRATRARVDEVLAPSGYKRYAVVHLEAKSSFREWGIDNLIELAQYLAQEYPDLLLLTTASEEYFAHFQLADRLAPNVQVFKTSSIHELAALLARAEVVISPDTAVVHLAAAMEKKMVAFYPHRDEWLPYTPKAVVLFPEVREPIESIRVDTVLEKIRPMLS